MYKVRKKLLKLNIKILYRDFSSHSIENQKIQIAKDEEWSFKIIPSDEW